MPVHNLRNISFNGPVPNLLPRLGLCDVFYQLPKISSHRWPPPISRLLQALDKPHVGTAQLNRFSFSPSQLQYKNNMWVSRLIIRASPPESYWSLWIALGEYDMSRLVVGICGEPRQWGSGTRRLARSRRLWMLKNQSLHSNFPTTVYISTPT